MSIGAIWRLARRDLLRRPWRSVLVVALIATPVALFTFAAIGMRTVPDTADEVATRVMGQADLLLRRYNTEPPLRLPANWRTVTWWSASSVVKAPGSSGVRARAQVQRLDLRDPLALGLFTRASGRLPGASDEVVVSPELLRYLGVRVGDSITVPPSPRPYRVVGTATGGSGNMNVVGPSVRMWSAPQGTLRSTLVDTRGSSATGWPGAPAGELLTRRSFATGSWGTSMLVVDLIGGLALAAFGLVVAAALSVGARRHLRAIGLMGAAGASPRQRASVMLLHGVTLGLAGVAIGLPAGLGAWSWARTDWSRLSPGRVGSSVIRISDLMVIILLALVTAVGAALVPARVASDTTVLHALAGRRPTPRVRRRVPIVGLVVSLMGMAMLAATLALSAGRLSAWAPVLMLVAAALMVGGMVIATPYVVGRLEGLATRAHGTARLAARAVARHRARTGPVVAAVMAAGALIVATATVVRSTTADGSTASASTSALRRVATLNIVAERADGSADPHPVRTVGCPRALRLAAPVARVLPQSTAVCLEALNANMWVVDAATLPTDGVGALPVAQLRAGKVLGTGERLAVGKRVLATISSPVPQALNIQGGIIDRGRARHLHLLAPTGNTSTVVFVNPTPIGDKQASALNALNTGDLGLRLGSASETLTAWVTMTTQPTISGPQQFLRDVALPVASVLVLLVVLLGVALLAADEQDEHLVLTALGAAPVHRRRMRATQAALLAVLGLVLALPVGLAAAHVVLRHISTHTVLPWNVLAVLLLGVPLAGAALAAASVRAGAPTPPRRAE